MARIGQPINLSIEEKQELLTMSRSHKLEKRYVERAMIILYSADRKSLDKIVELTGKSRPVINKWRQRFRENRLEGLKDAPRSGKPQTITPDQKALVIKTGRYSNSSQNKIAKEIGISQSRVFQILNQANLNLHNRRYLYRISRDPEFEERVVNIVGLYMNPPENAIVICVNEKMQIQTLDRTQTKLFLKSNRFKPRVTTYKQNDTVSLVASLAIHTSEITAKNIESNNEESFLKFLKKLDREYRNKRLHVIVDNLSIHKHKDLEEWLNGKRKIKLHFTSTYSSWLNQIEIWFNISTKNVAKGDIWKSSKQLTDQLMEHVKTYNSTRTKPFQWTYTGSPLIIS